MLKTVEHERVVRYSYHSLARGVYLQRRGCAGIGCARAHSHRNTRNCPRCGAQIDRSPIWSKAAEVNRNLITPWLSGHESGRLSGSLPSNCKKSSFRLWDFLTTGRWRKLKAKALSFWQFDGNETLKTTHVYAPITRVIKISLTSGTFRSDWASINLRATSRPISVISVTVRPCATNPCTSPTFARLDSSGKRCDMNTNDALMFNGFKHGFLLLLGRFW